nr:hypothetical protein [Endozoicomonas sp.]
IKMDAKNQVVKQRDRYNRKENDFLSNRKLHWIHCTRRQRTLRIDQHYSNETRRRFGNGPVHPFNEIDR